jgi:hypothetical protein
VDDLAHQYFGEASVEDLHLAKHAVVLLSHLCYASGNTEPGLAEGTQADAIQRVDNYAAGFIRAGASAVVAEGHFGPAYYVKQLLSTRLSIEQIWNRAPSRNGNTFALASTRSDGFTERLDPDRTSGGYYRSLVSAGVTAASVRASATGSATADSPEQPAVPAEPTLADLGLQFGSLTLRDLPIAGTSTKLTLPLSKAELQNVPKGTQVGARWDPIALDPSPVADAGPGGQAGAADGAVAPAPDASPVASPAASPAASANGSPAAGSPAASSAATPAAGAASQPGADAAAAEDTPPEPPTVDLVVPEQLGSVVTIAKSQNGKKGLMATIRFPTAPGLYRLVATLHTDTGVAYDAATQSLLTPVIVKVGGPVAVAWGVPGAVALSAGGQRDLAIRIVNAGSQRWDEVVTALQTNVAGEDTMKSRTTTVPAQVVATWVSVDGQPVPDAVVVRLDDKVAAPRGESTATLGLTAPANPGSYLLLLDVLTPSRGPLSALGSAPGLIRVTVGPAAAPASASPAPDATAPDATAPDATAGPSDGAATGTVRAFGDQTASGSGASKATSAASTRH